ncbi:DUF1254 domain-containing protein [Tropicimonas sediminicola]|uniref:Uncharacterized conserved protein n=1 Tax=Tropicimonas sediminicola TaxID=1031541 RepID=A0A239MBD1_9RHOB|nr:DUF1254 domain-containing protein [Tropicimonas sediminicola]SNT40317.1 Uncharacterized conserved protein [Tropicimonas sediminicola]
MKPTRRQIVASFTGLTAAAVVGARPEGAQAQAAQDLTTDEAREIGREVFLWGMHPVALYHLRYNFAQNEQNPLNYGINRLNWNRTPLKALPRIATTPNATTLYGNAMLDLSKEPVVITTPDIRDHYWSLQFYDNYARWWHMIGSQFNAPGQVRRLLIGPNWSGEFPDGFVGEEIVKSGSDFAGILGRVALTDDTQEELAVVNSIQDGFTVMSLSDWIAAGRTDVRPDDVPETKADYPTYPGMETIVEPARLAGVDFLRWVGLVLADPTFTLQEDGHQEILALERFARLGLKRGMTFDPETLTPEIIAAISDGIEQGRADALAVAETGTGVMRNGWDFTSDLDYKDTNWRQRAYYGLIAVLAPVPSRSHIGTFCMTDSNGDRLTGAHRYTLTFDLQDMPPVTEFWEIPLYDNEGYFVDNPIDRYSLNSYMLERGKLQTEGGKLVIYIQTEEPEDPLQLQNWLPAPEGDFQFTARFYGPYSSLIDGRYNMPGIVRVE